jgi:polyphenol oxidase
MHTSAPLRAPSLTFDRELEVGVRATLTERSTETSGSPFCAGNLGLHVGDAPDRVIANRARAAALIGATLEDLIIANQVHGSEVAVVTAGDRSRGARSLDDAPSVDALVTEATGVALAILVADCVPVLFVDPEGPRIGVAHAGWRGVAAGVLEGTIASLGGAAVAERLLVTIGPAIAPDDFEVGPEVVDALGLDDQSEHVRIRGGRHFVDLVGACVDRLVAAGVDPAAIVVSAHTTGAATPYFSARAERPSGRFAIMAVIDGRTSS